MCYWRYEGSGLIAPHCKHNGPGSLQVCLPTEPHAYDEANFTYRSVTLETSASSLIPAIWFCSPPGAYKTAPFSKSLTSLLAAGCLSGETSDPCHLSALQRNSCMVVIFNSRNYAYRVFPSTGHYRHRQSTTVQPGPGRTTEQGDPGICHTILYAHKRLEPCRFLRFESKDFCTIILKCFTNIPSSQQTQSNVQTQNLQQNQQRNSKSRQKKVV